MRYADIGTQVQRNRSTTVAMGGIIPPLPGPAASLSSSEAEMKAIDAQATSLLGDYQRNVASGEPHRAGYENWFSTVWKPFFNKNTGLLGPFSNILRTDALASQVEARRNELVGFRASYTTLVTPGGTPVPPPTDPNVPQAPPVAPPQPFLGMTIPWWAWLLGGVAVAGGGYLAYRSWKSTREEIQRQQHEVFQVLPSMLGHDVQAAPACATCNHGGV
jgi:hypothetical protein